MVTQKIPSAGPCSKTGSGHPCRVLVLINPPRLSSIRPTASPNGYVLNITYERLSHVLTLPLQTIVSDDSNTQGGSASKIGLAGIIGAVAGGTIGVVIVGVGLWVVLGCGGDEEGKVTPAHEHKA